MCVCVGLASGVCLQTLLGVLGCAGYISTAAFLEGGALWCWTPLPSWRDSLFCSRQQQHFLHFTVGLSSVHWDRNIQRMVISHLHVLHHIFRALHQDYSLEWRMLAHDSAYPVHSYNKLRERGFSNRPNSTLTEGWSALNVVLPALTCHTSGSPHSSHGRHHAASAGPWWYRWAAGQRARPDTPRTGSSRSGPESPCWFDLDRGGKEMRYVLVYSSENGWQLKVIEI